jgi:II/X family phage/plasmid replication protein
MAAMVDWVTARVPCTLPSYINGGTVLSIAPDGAIEWQTDKRRQLEGSHSAMLAVRGGGTELEISGNPVKWLQGHNLFGPSHPIPLIYHTMRRVVDILGVVPSAGDRRAWVYGEYDLLRVDVTRMYDLGEDAEVTRFLTGAAKVAKGRYQRTSAYNADTVYLGQKSKRVTVKFYNKLQELLTRGHGLPTTMTPALCQALLDFARGKLRYEVTLRTRELRDRELRRAASWNAGTADVILDDRLARVELNDVVRLPEGVVDQLPPKLLPIYHAWRAGTDFRALYSRPTFYRRRRELLAYGIDIAEVRPHEVVAKTEYLMGRSLRSFLVGPGVSPPEWAIGTDLVAS